MTKWLPEDGVNHKNGKQVSIDSIQFITFTIN